MTRRSLVQRSGVLLGLVLLSVFLFYIGKGHTLLIDTNAVTIDGKEFRSAEAIEVSIDSKEPESMGRAERIQVLVGGLDTVVNMLGFTFSYLAIDHDLRRAIAADPTRIDDALLEFFRRFPVVSSAREIMKEVEFEGVRLKAGDMVLAPTVVIAMDDARNDDPLEFRLGRKARQHSTFGKGSHTCPGATLARMEMKIVLQEWFARIPEFRLADDKPLGYVNGIVGSVKPFDLVWDV